MKNQYLIILILILSSCNNNVSKSKIARTTNFTTPHKVESQEPKVNNNYSQSVNIDKEKMNIYSIDSLTRADSTDLDFLRTNFPLSWERFGIENEDTVTYSFCAASNPQFSLNEELTSITIIIGNELHENFRIKDVFFNDSIFVFNFNEKTLGLERAVLLIEDRKRQIGKLLIYDNTPENSYSYLPHQKLINKRRIVYECDTDE
jgi:hypothetical protein